jgi:hypothetical protein
VSYLPSDFTAEMTLVAKQWAKYANLTAELQAIATALGADRTTHDGTIEAPPAALRIGAPQTSFTNDALLVVNKGKSGGVPNAQMATIINALASGGGSPSFTYPGAPAALYSVRKVGAGYAGACARVQRISDNAQQDINFVSATGVVDMGALASFGAGTNTFVVKWYDQSGAGNDLSAASGALPAQLNLINGVPWLAFVTGNPAGGGNVGCALLSAAAPALTGDQTIGFAGQLGTDLCCMPLSQFDGTNGWFFTFNGAGSGFQVGDTPGVCQYFTSGTSGAPLKDAGRYFAKTGRYVARRSSAAGAVFVNGAQTIAGTAANNAASTAKLSLGGQGASGLNFAGLVGEEIGRAHV